jgi:hypothetical protein
MRVHYYTSVSFLLLLSLVISSSSNTAECSYIAVAPRAAANNAAAATAAASIEYNKNDLVYVNHFLTQLKRSNGDWSKHGVQRIIRLASECSNSYVSLRNFRIKADVPVDEAFKDPYSKLRFSFYTFQVYFEFSFLEITHFKFG